MKVREFMVAPAEFVAPQATLREAAARMRTRKVGLLPVVEDGRAVGVVTDRDLVLRGTADGLLPDAAPVAAVMTRGAVTCRADDDINAAARKMEQARLRRLPVVDEQERVVGMLSLADFPKQGEGQRLVAEVFEAISPRR